MDLQEVPPNPGHVIQPAMLSPALRIQRIALPGGDRLAADEQKADRLSGVRSLECQHLRGNKFAPPAPPSQSHRNLQPAGNRPTGYFIIPQIRDRKDLYQYFGSRRPTKNERHPKPCLGTNAG